MVRCGKYLMGVCNCAIQTVLLYSVTGSQDAFAIHNAHETQYSPRRSIIENGAQTASHAAKAYSQTTVNHRRSQCRATLNPFVPLCMRTHIIEPAGLTDHGRTL